MKITRSVVPSLFTVLNIFCGFLSIVNTAHGYYVDAAWFIVVAALFDVFDGVMARITRSYSDFGVEFDSLSDIVSFGVAPSFMVYTVYLHTLGGIGTLISALPMVFGAMRLARFNVQLVGYDKDYFKGLPIPSAAVTLAAFVMTYVGDTAVFSDLKAELLISMVILLALLMVSTFKYDTVPKFTRRGLMQHPLRFTIGVIGLSAIFFTGGEALFPFFIFYVSTGPLRYFFGVIRRALKPGERRSDEDQTEVTSIDV